jgi:YVTN family beta-propeller protein
MCKAAGVSAYWNKGGDMRPCAVLWIAGALNMLGGTGYKIESRYPVSGDGGFDYVTLDSEARKLYLSHGTLVNVVDPDTGKPIGVIPDTPGVHGIAIASEFQHGFTSNGRENKVSMFDAKTLQVAKKIDVGKGPDGIYYHAGTKRIFTNNHGSHDVTAIDAANGTVVGTVKLEGDGEQAIIGADGLVYVNSEDTAEVVVFDPQSLTVKKRFPIGVAKTPTGLAYDARTNRLFIGCRNAPKMVVMDAATGKVINSYSIGGNVDYAAFDPGSRLIFFSCGEGVLSIYHQTSSDEYEDAGAVKTQPSAKTMAFDPKTGKIFLSAAEFLEAPANPSGQSPRREVKPGSFVVLVVGK